LRDWRLARVGDTFVVGDALRTGSNSFARVTTVFGGWFHLSPESMIRFLARPPGQPGVVIRVESGEAEIETGSSAETTISTYLGIARIERGGRVRVLASDGRTGIEVLIGRVVLERNTSNAPSVTAVAGQRVMITLSGAVLEEVHPSGTTTAVVSSNVRGD